MNFNLSYVGGQQGRVLSRVCLLVGTAKLVERWTRDRQVAGSILSWTGGTIFVSRVNFLSRLLFGARAAPVIPQWHVKDPGHSAKNAGGRLQLNTHTPLNQRSRSGLTNYAVQAYCGNLSGK